MNRLSNKHSLWKSTIKDIVLIASAEIALLHSKMISPQSRKETGISTEGNNVQVMQCNLAFSIDACVRDAKIHMLEGQSPTVIAQTVFARGAIRHSMLWLL